MVGKNNTGKSTILDAIQTFSTILHSGSIQPQDDHVWPYGKPSKESIFFNAIIELTKKELDDADVVNRERIVELLKFGIVNVEVSCSITKGITPSLTIDMRGDMNRDGPSISKKEIETPLLGYIRTSLGNSKRIDVIRGQVPPPPDMKRGIRGILIPKATIDDLRVWINSRQSAPLEKFEEVNRVFKSLTNKPWNLHFEGDHLCVNDGGYVAEMSALGGGVQEMVHLAFELVNAPLLLMIEEPETHSHPEQAKSVFNLLKTLSKTHIIFIATHSTVFAQSAGFSEIFQVYKEKGETECRKIDDSNFASLVADLGISPADVFMTSSLIFVEGECDQIVLESWAKMLGYSIEPPEAGIIRMDGMGKAKHHSAVWQGVIERLPLPMVWIFDYNVDNRLIDDLTKKGVKEGAVIRLEGDIEDYYPKDQLLNHLCQTWNLDQDKRTSLELLLVTGKNSKIITEFLKKEGDPQPEANEWKKPAARYIANKTHIDEYTDSERARIIDLMGQIMELTHEK